MTVDPVTGIITGLLVTGAMVWALAILHAAAALARLAGRGLLWAVRRACRTAPSANCGTCGGDFEHCTCGTPRAPIPRPYVPSWAREDGAVHRLVPPCGTRRQVFPAGVPAGGPTHGARFHASLVPGWLDSDRPAIGSRSDQEKPSSD